MHMQRKTDAARESLKSKAAQELRRASRLPEDERAPALREAAGYLVELRSLFTTKAGDTDWRGQSWDYRRAVGEVYGDAGLAPDDPIKVALRYHIGNALREDLTPEQLEEAGLSARAPRDRMQWRYKKGANNAEFARQLVYRMTRTPALEPDPATLKHAKALHKSLGAWIKRHDG